MTILSDDRMVDVFPVVFDFKRGEQPSSEKLTKWVRLTDNAFSLITRAVGDPWDYQWHGGTIDSEATLELSPQKLSQPTIARSIGPAGYVGPIGESINTDATTVVVTIDVAGANSWFFGFPFIKVMGAVTPGMLNDGAIQFLDDSDIVFSGDAGLIAQYFTDYCEDPRDMQSDGDYSIDFATGVVCSYRPIDAETYATSTGIITVTISNLASLGGGAPWASHNVIPIWEEGTDAGVSIIETIGPGTYEITLPDHTKALPRIGKAVSLSGMSGGGYPSGDRLLSHSQTTFSSRPTEGLPYVLPVSITESFVAGDVFPDGVLKLWKNVPGYFVPLTEFEYIDATTIRLICPELDDVGAEEANTTGYRLIITGSSLAEQVSYLMALVRDNPGQGLAYGGVTTFPSMTYAPPVSHDRLRDRFSMSARASGTDDVGFSAFKTAFPNWETRFSFRESDVPTNPHPQYLHRAGWMAQDETGNSGNAMRGELVFTTQLDPYTGSMLGQRYDTWGIRFGGGPSSTAYHDQQHTHIGWEGSKEGKGSTWGGEAFDDLLSVDRRLNFTNILLGATTMGLINDTPSMYSQSLYGATVYSPRFGAPLYLRGQTHGPAPIYPTNYERGLSGGTLAFDLADGNEMNYVKLMPADRSLTNILDDQINIPIPNFSALSKQLPSLNKLPISPDVLHDFDAFPTAVGDYKYFGRWSSSQIREFRFRGVSENVRTILGNQSIAAGEGAALGGVGTQEVSMPLTDVYVGTSHTFLFIDGNYSPLLYPGLQLTIGAGANSAGTCYVKIAFYIEELSTPAILDKTVVLIGVDGCTSVPQTEISLSGVYVTCTGQEMMSKFVSPSVVGADYMNVYGNAIFFSESGGGARTSFTDRGWLWLDYGVEALPYVGDQTPSGLFYVPQDDDTSPTGSYYAFSLSEEGHSAPNYNDKQTRWPLMFGDNIGMRGSVIGEITFSSHSEDYTKTASLNLKPTNGELLLRGEDYSKRAEIRTYSGVLQLYGTESLSINSPGEISIGTFSTDRLVIQEGISWPSAPSGPGTYWIGRIFETTLYSPSLGSGYSLTARVVGTTTPYSSVECVPNYSKIEHYKNGTDYGCVKISDSAVGILSPCANTPVNINTRRSAAGCVGPGTSVESSVPGVKIDRMRAAPDAGLYHVLYDASTGELLVWNGA